MTFITNDRACIPVVQPNCMKIMLPTELLGGKLNASQSNTQCNIRNLLHHAIKNA